MKAALTLILALCLRANASPTKVSEDPALAYRMVHLRTPSSAEVEKVINSIPENNGNGRIIGGSLAAQNQFPYQVAILTSWGTFGAGSVIAPRWVLTAAHVIPSGDYDWLRVLGCGNNWRNAGVQEDVIQAFQNPNWDIGLVKVGNDLPYSECLKPVELETEGCHTNALDDSAGVTSGWGSRASAGDWVQDELWFVDGTVISNEECARTWVVHDEQICVKANGDGLGIGCGGDSGGPLVWSKSGRQIGVVNWTLAGNCEGRVPTGFSRVPCFIEWIRNIQNTNP